MRNRFFKKAAEFSWYSMIALLPITSMPLVSSLFGSSSVASPSIIFLLILVVVWLVPAILKNYPLHKSVLPLTIFVIVSLVGTIISFFYDIPAYKGINQFLPIISAVSTLLIGFMFFICASSFPTDATVIEKTMRVINWSAVFMFVWSGLQIVSWYTMHKYPQWMFDIQGILSARVLYRQRVTGFALEPSWFAHLLNMLYLPFWLSFTLQKKSSHSFQISFLTMENILLVFGVVFLFLTLSRVGIVSFLMMLILAGVILHKRIVQFIMKKITGKKRVSKKMVTAGLISSYFVGIGLVAFIFSKIDPRMATLFNFSFENENAFITYFNELKFGDRVIYWLTGWNIFGKYPALGVGLGNAGFFFPSAIPPQGWRLVEVSKLINRTDILLNIKSLWFRLLAETGLVGFSIFIGWFISLSYFLVEKMKAKQTLLKIFGFAGGFVLLGILFEGLSIDSFAMPYWWISLGIAISSTQIQEKDFQKNNFKIDP